MKRINIPRGSNDDEEEFTHEDMRRWQCTNFKLWTVCAERRCRHAKSCAGDPEACLWRWWRHIPEDFKAYYRAWVRAMQNQKLDSQQVHEAAMAELERWRELEAKFAAERAAAAAGATAPAEPGPPPPPVAPRTVPDSRAPRIRSL